jgi:hypothetical protein
MTGATINFPRTMSEDMDVQWINEDTKLLPYLQTWWRSTSW